jgi:hypothetical protein
LTKGDRGGFLPNHFFKGRYFLESQEFKIPPSPPFSKGGNP